MLSKERNATVYLTKPISFQVLLADGFVEETGLKKYIKDFYRPLWRKAVLCGPQDSGVHDEDCPLYGVEMPSTLITGLSDTSLKDGETDKTRLCPYPGCRIHIVDEWYEAGRHLCSHYEQCEQPYLCRWDGCGAGHSQKTNLVKHFQTHIGANAKAMLENWCQEPVIEEDGTVRPCDFRCNDANWLERHRRGSDGYGRHAEENATIGLPVSCFPTVNVTTTHEYSTKRKAPESGSSDCVPCAKKRRMDKSALTGLSSVSFLRFSLKVLKPSSAFQPPPLSSMTTVFNANVPSSSTMPQAAMPLLSPTSPIPPPQMALQKTRPVRSLAFADKRPPWLLPLPMSESYRGGLTGAFSVHPNDIRKWAPEHYY